jgi:Ca-activated chloride channel family protein
MNLIHRWFAHPQLLWSLAVLPALVVLGLWARRRRRRALAQLGSFHLLAAQAGRRRWPALMRGLFLTLGLALAGVAAAGPQWDWDFEQSAAPGRDLFVVVDCSRSMLAETPSRLERARSALKDLARAVEEKGGHRLALIFCAGQARVACPLTHDCDYFRETLDQLDDAPFEVDLQPGPRDASGTRLGKGLILAVAKAHDPRCTDILLLSDGDDPARDGEWRLGADKAHERGIPVYTVGIGNPNEASPIRLDGAPLVHDGREVRTRLQEDLLREVARPDRLNYWGRSHDLQLGARYLEAIAGLPVREESDDPVPVRRQHHGRFLLWSFLSLASALTLGDGPRRRRSQEGTKE